MTERTNPQEIDDLRREMAAEQESRPTAADLQSMINSPWSYASGDISKVLDGALKEIARLQAVLQMISVHRQACHEYDDAVHVERRSFCVIDVYVLEQVAKTALQGGAFTSLLNPQWNIKLHDNT